MNLGEWISAAREKGLSYDEIGKDLRESEYADEDISAAIRAYRRGRIIRGAGVGALALIVIAALLFVLRPSLEERFESAVLKSIERQDIARCGTIAEKYVLEGTTAEQRVDSCVQSHALARDDPALCAHGSESARQGCVEAVAITSLSLPHCESAADPATCALALAEHLLDKHPDNPHCDAACGEAVRQLRRAEACEGLEGEAMRECEVLYAVHAREFSHCADEGHCWRAIADMEAAASDDARACNTRECMRAFAAMDANDSVCSDYLCIALATRNETFCELQWNVPRPTCDGALALLESDTGRCAASENATACIHFFAATAGDIGLCATSSAPDACREGAEQALIRRAIHRYVTADREIPTLFLPLMELPDTDAAPRE